MKPTQDYITVKLSTPHGALGTCESYGFYWSEDYLSTPHGALGTLLVTQTPKSIPQTFNSTRCIRNLAMVCKEIVCKALSTPHGALGTEVFV